MRSQRSRLVSWQLAANSCMSCWTCWWIDWRASWRILVVDGGAPSWDALCRARHIACGEKRRTPPVRCTSLFFAKPTHTPTPRLLSLTETPLTGKTSHPTWQSQDTCPTLLGHVIHKKTPPDPWQNEKKFGKKISRHHLTREINFPKLSLFRDRPTDGLITRLSSSVIFRTCVLFVCLCAQICRQIKAEYPRRSLPGRMP